MGLDPSDRKPALAEAAELVEEPPPHLAPQVRPGMHARERAFTPVLRKPKEYELRVGDGRGGRHRVPQHDDKCD
eukprot:5621487-Pyramimonas_sp.AAC.1